MATRYGYVSRDKANRQVDWGEIGKQVSDDIVKISEDRKARKEDILTKSTDYAKMLIEMPMGSNTAFNEYLAEFTSQASKASLADLNALKRGDITEQEYYNRRANLLSGTELMIAGATNFNKNYDLIQERIDSGIASAVEIKYRAKMAELLEFGNRSPFINPDTREVNTARLAPSGIMETTVEDIASASDMFRISNFQLDKFDMNQAVESMKNSLGVQQYTEDETGNSIKYAFNQELMSTEEIAQAKKELVSSYMKDDKAVISILGDYVPDYDVTLDPFAVNDKTVLIARDGTYEITDDQRKAAEKYMIKQLDRALPKTVKPGMSEYQEASLKSQELTRLENIRQFEEKMKLEREKLNLLEAGQTESINSPLTIIRSTKGTELAANDYIRSLDVNDFDSFTNKKDVVVDLQTILDKAKLPNSQITYTQGGEDVTPPIPLTKDRLGRFQNNPFGHKITGTSNNPSIRTKETIDIFVPGVMNAPVRIPITETIAEDVERLLTIIELKKLNKGIIDENELSFIPFNDYYNQGLQNEEEEVVVEDETVVVDPSKYNN